MCAPCVSYTGRTSCSSATTLTTMGVSRKRKKRKVRRPSSLVVARELDSRESRLLRLARVNDAIILYLDVVFRGSEDVVVEQHRERSAMSSFSWSSDS
jgi:hypothetical protein